jgi:Na+/proline symporter
VEHTAVSSLLLKVLLVPMVALWAFHLYQRRYKEKAVRKRIATLSLTSVIIVGWVAAWIFSRYGVGDVYLVLVALLAIGVILWQRRLMLPYRLRCVRCGTPLSVTRIFSHDSNACGVCEPELKEGETPR